MLHQIRLKCPWLNLLKFGSGGLMASFWYMFYILLVFQYLTLNKWMPAGVDASKNSTIPHRKAGFSNVTTGCPAKKYIQLKVLIFEKVWYKFKQNFHGCKNISLSSFGSIYRLYRKYLGTLFDYNLISNCCQF